MNCSEIQKQLSNYLDESIANNIKEIINAHLKTCPACRQKLEILRKLGATLDLVDGIQASDDFENRVIRQIKVTKGAVHERIHLFGQLKKWALIGTAAAIFIFVVLVGNYMGTTLHHEYAERQPKKTVPMITLYEYGTCSEVPDSSFSISYLNLRIGGMQ